MISISDEFFNSYQLEMALLRQEISHDEMVYSQKRMILIEEYGYNDVNTHQELAALTEAKVNGFIIKLGYYFIKFKIFISKLIDKFLSYIKPIFSKYHRFIALNKDNTKDCNLKLYSFSNMIDTISEYLEDLDVMVKITMAFLLNSSDGVFSIKLLPFDIMEKEFKNRQEFFNYIIDAGKLFLIHHKELFLSDNYQKEIYDKLIDDMNIIQQKKPLSELCDDMQKFLTFESKINKIKRMISGINLNKNIRSFTGSGKYEKNLMNIVTYFSDYMSQTIQGIMKAYSQVLKFNFNTIESSITTK